MRGFFFRSVGPNVQTLKEEEMERKHKRDRERESEDRVQGAEGGFSAPSRKRVISNGSEFL